MKCIEKAMLMTGREEEDLKDNECPLSLKLTPQHNCNEECSECWDAEILPEWVYAFDYQDAFTSSSYQTKEEAIEVALNEAKQWNGLVRKISVGRKELMSIPAIDVSKLLESIDEEYHDQISGDVDGGEYLFEDITNEQEKELENMLNEIFSEWINRCGVESTYYNVEEVEEIPIMIQSK